jgi:uncharacterized protein YfcZ (UPF0381/DUF406 family)
MHREAFIAILPPHREVGMIKLDLRQIKQVIARNPNDCRSKMETIYPLTLKKRAEEHVTWLTSQIKAVSIEPHNVRTYVEQVRAIDYIDDNFI